MLSNKLMDLGSEEFRVKLIFSLTGDKGEAQVGAPRGLSIALVGRMLEDDILELEGDVGDCWVTRVVDNSEGNGSFDGLFKLEGISWEVNIKEVDEHSGIILACGSEVLIGVHGVWVVVLVHWVGSSVGALPGLGGVPGLDPGVGLVGGVLGCCLGGI